VTKEIRLDPVVLNHFMNPVGTNCGLGVGTVTCRISSYLPFEQFVWEGERMGRANFHPETLNALTST
jgi:hypothetical protein